MTGAEFGTAVAGKAVTPLLRRLHDLVRLWTWRRRLARDAVKAVAAEQSARQTRDLRRLIKQSLTEPAIVKSLRNQDQLGIEETSALLRPRLRDSLRRSFGDDWEPILQGLCREIRDRYFDELPAAEAVRLTHQATQADGVRGLGAGQAVLPSLVTESLFELETRGEEVIANSLRAWMTEPTSRRSDKIAEFMENPEKRLPLMAQASYLAWETVGYFVSAYDLGNPHVAYAIAIQGGSPRRILFQIEEALRRFNGTNIADACRVLDQLPQEDALVGVARALVEDDMTLALSRLESGGVCESEDPATARFGKHIRIIALVQNGEVSRAIDFAREAIREYPGYSSRRTLCSHLLAVAAQEERTDGARQRRLAEEGAQLALEARDMIREWHGPSGPAVAVAMACKHLLRDPNAVCALATLCPAGEATEHEASHPEVVAYLAKALGMLERFEELRELDRSGLSEFDSVIIEAWLARHDNEPGAIDLMRRAMSLAEGEVELSAARQGLASLGGAEELAADSGLQAEPSAAALLASMAAVAQGDLDQALASIQPHKWDSMVHARQFAHVLIERGEVDGAVAHFEAAATRFTAQEFLHFAVELLMDESRFEDAEPLVATGLTRAAEPALRKILHGQSIEIANHRSDPSEMLQRAEAASAEFPEQVRFRWGVIAALYRQGDLQRAYQYLREHNVEASDRQMHRLEISLRAQFDRSPETIDCLLGLADSYPGDEEFLSFVLVSIFEASQELELSEAQAMRLNSLVGAFLNEFPTSNLFQMVEAPDIEGLIGKMRAMLEPGSVQQAETAEKVSLGQRPFGMMQVALGRPYALTLVGGAADALVAIPLEDDVRRQELEAAKAALNNPVAIDTSGIVLWQQHLSGSAAIARCFSEILLPTELLADLRQAERAVQALASARGAMGIHPATGDLWMSEADPELLQATQKVIAEMLAVADRCTHAESMTLCAPDFDDVPSRFAPWDAAFRVALDRGCALWTDDAFMRALAKHYGVPAFGTYALHQALMSTSAVADLPSELDFKRSLISARVADVPLTWAELEAISEHDRAGSVGFILERPWSWNDPVQAFRCFRQTLTSLRDEGREVQTPYLLYAATLGAGRATDKDGIPRAASALLTAALLTGIPHKLVPEFVAASRSACQKLTLSNEIDPLPVAASNLVHEANERLPNPEAAFIGHYVMGIFSGLEEDDRHIVSAAILGASLD